jgi:16S rRNA G1207 methylase RsmC
MNDSPPDPILETTLRVGDGARVLERLRGGELAVWTAHGLRVGEALMLEALPMGKQGAFLVIGGKDAIVAEALLRLNPEATVEDHHHDAFQFERARERLEELFPDGRGKAVLGVAVPDDKRGFQAAFLVQSHHDDTALAFEHLNDALRELAPRAILTVALDSPRDHLIRERMKKVFGDVTLRADPERRGVTLVSRKKPDAKLPKPPALFSFTVAERGEILTFVSRPGVFSATKLDDGARALMHEMDPRDGESVLDLGCGTGVIGIVAARRAALARLVLLDANLRALDAARQNAERLLEDRTVDVRCVLSAEPLADLDGETFDLVLANPPYFSDYRIAQLFLDTAAMVLRRQGRLLLVSKQVKWYRENLPQLFTKVSESERGGYTIWSARR